MREEIIELNGKEYVLELNRQSAIKIEQYTDLQKSIEAINKDLIEHIEEINENEDPFANEVNYDTMQEEAKKQEETLKKMICRAFWIWLFPKNRLNINEVQEILNSYFENGDKLRFISEKFGEYFKISTDISEKYLEEVKNLKAQANK